MTLHEDVVSWAANRPQWQQEALARLARGEVFSDDDIERFVGQLLESVPVDPTEDWLSSLTVDQATADDPIVLLAVQDVQNVNRLAPGQALTFCDHGLTVVFGQNGSGKSGYARILQSMVRTRTKASLLPNVFGPSGAPGGTLLYRIGEDTRALALDDEPPAELARAAFYDETTGDDYLANDSQVLYRPALLSVFDDLVATCDRIRASINEKRQALDTQKGPLPQVSLNSPDAQFLSKLSASTSDDEIMVGCLAADGLEEELTELRAEQARIQATNPNTEKTHLTAQSAALEELANHLDRLSKNLGSEEAKSLADAREAALTARQAADLAAQQGFDDEPLTGVGRSAWRQLWESASRFSSEAYGDYDFPHTGDGAVCVLCQQPLAPDGKSRLERFAKYVEDDTAQKAQKAQRYLNNLETIVRQVQVEPPSVLHDIATLAAAQHPLASAMDQLLAGFKARQARLLDADIADGEMVDASTTATTLREAAARLAATAATISDESFQASLESLSTKERQLCDAIAMRDGKPSIVAERDRLRRRSALDHAYSMTNTRTITERIAEWTRTHVTAKQTGRFARETQELSLEDVTLEATRPRKGVLYQRPSLIGSAVPAQLTEVLSEGEQTALGLAGFLTEAAFDTSKSALVFDDPVTSLDHVRREKVANRLVHYAQDRQVIIFTHDAAFCADLRRAAERESVDFTERCVSRSRGKEPGHTSSNHPWTAKDVKQRIHCLKESLARIRKEHAVMEDEDYCQRVRTVAGEMSETWERIISQEIAGRLVDYRTFEVAPKMLKVVANFTLADEQEFQQSYSRISGWAPRHDNHPDLNWTAPDLDELDREVLLIEAWFARIQQYKK